MAHGSFERFPRLREEAPLLKSPIFWIAVAIVLAAGAGLYFWRERSVQEQATEAQPPVQEVPAPEAATGELVPAPSPEPQIQHPIPEVEAALPDDSKPLPALDVSDAPMQQSLAEAFTKERPFAGLALSQDLVRHLVATVDNLPRQHVGRSLLPLRPPPGRLVASEQGEVVVLSPENHARYTRYVKLAQAIDTNKLVAVYVRFYPLFQQAYEELGYPNRYFNDRVVEVIDHLLATPEVQGPLELEQFGSFYQFADPDVEDLSAGRKLLIRIGPDNAAVIKAKLRDIRRDLISDKPQLVIPGPRSGTRNPESRPRTLWIPGSALAGSPGMTAFGPPPPRC